MKLLRIGIYVCTLLALSSIGFGQDPYYAVVGGSLNGVPQLTVINVNTQQIVGRLAVPQPIGGVVITGDNAAVFATASGTPAAPANAMYVIDISTPSNPTLITTIEELCGVGPGRELPTQVVLSLDEASAYAACLGNPNPGQTPGRYVAKVDTATLEVVAHIDLAQGSDTTPGPFSVIPHPNGEEVWAGLYGSALTGRDRIARISVADDLKTGSIVTGASPTGGVFCPDGSRAFWSLNRRIGQNAILELSPAGSIVNSTNVPVGTVGLALTPDCATLYGAGYGNLAVQRDQLIVMNTATGVVNSFAVGNGPFNVVVAGPFLLLTMFGGLSAPGDTVKILDRVSLDLLANVNVGPAPSGIAVTVPLTE